MRPTLKVNVLKTMFFATCMAFLFGLAESKRVVGDWPARQDGWYMVGFLALMGMVNVAGYFLWKYKLQGH
ncbi:hypothetical protein EB796_018662 [Bugula neritina]|uniref:Uncharacterized protein n=1 Tax=Bugula neritina TaxID=10212 RepID=A0A7J7J9W9_BUGNE|nr:hypothetical protein EB796_018662 [Bugula neritina]